MALEYKVFLCLEALFMPSLIQQRNSRRRYCVCMLYARLQASTLLSVPPSWRRYASMYASFNLYAAQLLEPTTFVCVCVCVFVCGQRQRAGGTRSRLTRWQRKCCPRRRLHGDRYIHTYTHIYIYINTKALMLGWLESLSTGGSNSAAGSAELERAAVGQNSFSSHVDSD